MQVKYFAKCPILCFLCHLTSNSVELLGGGADMLAIETDNVVAQRSTERALHNVLQLWCHLLRLGEQVDEELRHVLLLPGVERLVVHGVGLAEGERVVGLPLRFQQVGEHPGWSVD